MRPTDGQMISLLSHTIGSLGNVINKSKDDSDDMARLKEIYNGYIQKIEIDWFG